MPDNYLKKQLKRQWREYFHYKNIYIFLSFNYNKIYFDFCIPSNLSHEEICKMTLLKFGINFKCEFFTSKGGQHEAYETRSLLMANIYCF